MTGLRTGSVQIRVAVATIAVLVAVLIGLGLVIDTIFAVQSERSLDALLTGRAQLARQLARTGVRPQQLVNRVDADGVRARLVLRDGTEYGSIIQPGDQTKITRTKLAGPGRIDGATLTLGVDLALNSDARSVLRQVLLITGAVAIVISAGLVVLAVRLSLSPLGAMARLARTIAGGDRGRRLRPTRPNTELGRTAVAFDEMLDELEGAEQRARQAEERTKEFLADAAHELRTPIAGIQAAAESLLHYHDQLSAAERERLQQLLIGETGRAGSLVNDLLTAARLDAGLELNRTMIDVTESIDADLHRARALHPELTFRREGGSALAFADPDRLSGILRNLIDNAGRAVADQGTILITVEPTADRVLIRVEDDGPGIPAADRDRVFDRLVRLDQHRSTVGPPGGFGLGLAIARGYARAQGGDLTCLAPRTLPGAHFLLTLPSPT
ncbi:sensor histidine kinase [Microlunatus speluncae]|uniref:sensor histidine kinase n=1 Tax=Microlunatus speluncae TaxID=2594267 RepID=UPI0012664664|nr:HAMP domain-containing sensor histidine kinase [Microlunatus speluncae]